MVQSFSLLRSHADADMPSVTGVLGQAMVFVLVLVGLAVGLTPADEALDYHFTDENGFITALSAFFLAVSSAFCVARLALFPSGSFRQKYTWTLLASGFAFLAIDEVFMIHEQIGWWMDDAYSSGPFRNWNDIVVIGYGVIAIFLFAPTARVLARLPVMPFLMMAAFLAYTAHTAIDSLATNATVASMIVEESFKLLCALLLAASAFEGLKAVSKD